MSTPKMIFRKLEIDEIERIQEIDRSEEIFEFYKFQNQKLVLYPDYQLVIGFSEQDLKIIIPRQYQLIQAGGVILGAFAENKLIGIASLENKKRGSQLDYCKMDILYVSRPYRGRKIAHQLLELTKKVALRFGAKKLYISATPTKNTIDFYLKQQAKITEEIDTELFALEPEDIHLEMVL